MTSIIIFLVMLVFFIVFIVIKGVILVQQSQEVVIERLGQFNKVLGSGLHIIIPGLDRPRSIEWRFVEYDATGKMVVSRQQISRIDLRETVFDFARQNVITRDNVLIEINALLYFQVVESKRVVYEIENLPEAIEKLAQTSLRSLIGELSLDESLSSRDTINAKLQEILDEATEKWGVKINRVELQDISPPEDIRQAMEKEMRAERDRRAEVTMAEGAKKSAILKAEGLKESNIIEAEGEALARIRIAQAEAEAIRRVTQALQETGANPSQYLIAMRYIETLQEMVSGKDNKVVYIPVEATGILASLGGIKEIFKDMNVNTIN
ncbi:SPFH/Band 7/PHB domain protein [candidate division KSB1 bacterium]|nr:SPFH/Band 7/PHB domain protein [candidate division KSB1 bacterium]RQW04843.1 MAG: SPFH/Band 7/PHB domain protein [candidate division KSB1 bacterium]